MERNVKQTLMNSDHQIAQQDEEKQHHGGSFRKYMEHKNSKLQEQFAANAAVVQKSNIFNGVVIFCNGYTIPTHAELKQLMAEHGGTFENYYSRLVTHIICSNLPDAKVKQFQKERNPTPVVRPEWITESLSAGKLLPIQEFVLWQLKIAPGQRTLHGAFDTNPSTKPLPPVSDPSAGTSVSPFPPPPQQQYNKYADVNKPQQGYDPQELAAAQEIAARMRAECDVLKGGPHSSKDDPNFVESYFRASRLHFIGTWKTRLEALMASSVAVQAPNPAPYVLGGGPRVILHLDMDCFFASVAEAGHPEFKGKPLAVCHSNSARGSGEVSSANYEARKFGVGASMFISRAKELCPALIVVPYEFDKYEKVSEDVYRILLKYTSAVQPVSCDEAFLDVTGLGEPEEIAASIRRDIYEATGCTASAGIGPNMLLARIATKRAKPNGQFYLKASAALPLLAELKVGDLPGVGWSTEQKLEEMGIKTVADIHASSKSALQAELGSNAGSVLWEIARGRDTRRVEPPKPRRSVGAEVNWGVRFQTAEDPVKFIENIAVEVAGRMKQAGVKGRTITLKLKRRKPGAGEPAKFLGCGVCDNLSKSVTLASATAAVEDLTREGTALLRMLRVPYEEIRGVGLTVTRLDSVDPLAAAAGGGDGRAGGKSPTVGGVEIGRATAVGAAGNRNDSAGWEVNSSEEDVEMQEAAVEGGAAAGAAVTAPSAAAAGSQPETTPRRPTSASHSPASGSGKKGTKRKSPGSGGKQTSLLEMMPPPPPRSRQTMGAGGYVYDEDEVTVTGSSGGRTAKSARRELLSKYEGMSLTQIDADELNALPYQVQMELISKLPRTRAAVAVGSKEVAGGDELQPAAAAAGVPALPTAVERPEQQVFEKEDSVASGSSIDPLPAFSQVDQSVLDALPLQLRREIEAAYGVKAAPGARKFRRNLVGDASAGPSRRGGSSRGNIISKANDRKLRRIDAFVISKDDPAPEPLAGPSRDTSRITLSQIDPGVLHELPKELQDEVLRQLQPFPKSKAAKAATKRAVAQKAAAAEISRQQHNLEELQAAQIEDSSEDEEVESRVIFAVNLEEESAAEGNLPEVQKLLESVLAIGSAADVFGGSCDGLLRGFTASIAATVELEEDEHTWKSVSDDDDEEEDGPSSSPREEEEPAPLISKSEKAFRIITAAMFKAGKLCIAGDLETTRRVLICIKRSAKKYPSFGQYAEALVTKLQRRVERRYGWPLALPSE